MPFVTACREQPQRLLSVARSGTWLAVVVGALAAVAVAAVPLIGEATEFPVPPSMSWDLPRPAGRQRLAVAVGSSATSVLVALGHSSW